jgi:hypothetical protein
LAVVSVVDMDSLSVRVLADGKRAGRRNVGKSIGGNKRKFKIDSTGRGSWNIAI